MLPSKEPTSPRARCRSGKRSSLKTVRSGLKGNGTIKRLAWRHKLTHAAAVPLLLLGTGVAHGQLQEDTPIRVNVRLVRILATVKDPSGALVGSLNKEDFQVRDNGVPQTISV